MTLAYIATPYEFHPEGPYKAFQQAAKLAGELLKAGIHGFSPIAHGHVLSLYADIDGHDTKLWYEFNDLFLDRCDSLIVAHLPGWETSAGVAYEIDFFEAARKPIFDLNPNSLSMVRRTMPWEAVA